METSETMFTGPTERHEFAGLVSHKVAEREVPNAD